MLVKLYALLWIIGILAAGIFYFTDNFTPLVAIIFGFLSFAAIYGGLISVLPVSETHQSSAKH